MIVGKVGDGFKGASKIPEEVFCARRRAAKANLVRGTLNIFVVDISDAVSYLGEPDFETDRDNLKLGALRWWGVSLQNHKIFNIDTKTFIVRHYNTKTNYLEIMGEVHYRDRFGIINNDEITVLNLS